MTFEIKQSIKEFYTKLDQLKEYRPSQTKAPDFADFWRSGRTVSVATAGGDGGGAWTGRSSNRSERLAQSRAQPARHHL